ncbi:ABC transporter ATP-binding protein [alpha proteobacterium BAL199]|jgi:peptide/nickel transport system ATP-binding protein|nr:ABC transporter ATP-binding protein [alpha proteobacterium BAL199]
MSVPMPDAAAAPVLRVAGLTTSFRVGGEWKTVVDDVSFDIGARETVAVVGESGSGKSVTALSIMRLVPTANGRIQGRIELEGRNLPDLTEERMRDVRGGEIGMIFQEPMTSLNPVLTVGFQVSEALRRHRGMTVADADREALRLFDLVRIPDAARRFSEFPHTFSGGMRQRVMIAIALACRPKLLIADEPTTALDVTIQAQILGLIRELQREIGMSVMFITHDMGVVAEIADRVVVMWRGDKVEEATAERLFAAPEHPYTRQLLTAVPKLGSLRGHAMPRRFPNVDLRRSEGEIGEVFTKGGDTAAAEPEDEPDRRGAPILEVSGLTTRFAVRGGLLGRPVGAVHAVEDVSFTLRAGETLALVGESGCGKSTTGRSILRLVEPTAGTVRFEGQDLMELGKADLRAVRRRLQMIFQDPYGSLNPRKTVGAALREPIVVHGLAEGAAADRRVAALLERVGLEPDHAIRFPHEFSGGQRQRICIARSLALQPKVLVADESVSALDVSIKAQVINLMMELQAEMGLAYLFISHDIAVVERISHRVAVMYLGEIVEIGPRAAVLDNPQHPYTKRLIAAVPVPDPSLRRERGGLMTEEIKSPTRPLGWAPPPSRLVEVGPEHFAREG